MRGKIGTGIILATGAGLLGGKYLFEPYLEQQRKERETLGISIMAPSASSSSDASETHAAASATPPPTIASLATPNIFSPNSLAQTPSAIANTRTLAHLPSTEISRSAHPDDAARIMEEPLPSSPLVAKKIPSKEDSGEMQAEPYTKSADTGFGLFERVKFW